MPEIKKIVLASGKARYRAVVDIGRDPETGRRRQKTITLDRRKDVVDEINRIGHQRRTGDYVQPSTLTVDEALDQLLPALTSTSRRRPPGTTGRDAPGPRPSRPPAAAVHRRAGHRRPRALDAHRGRVRGGKTGTGLGVRAVSLTLGRLRAVLNEAVRRKMVVRNVAAFTKIPRAARKAAAAAQEARRPWSAPTRCAPSSSASATSGCSRRCCSLWGCGRPRCAGCAGSDVDLDAGTLRVANTRTLVVGEVIEKAAKSAQGKRELPLPAPVAAALRTFRAQQAAERLASGPGYADSGYVLVDEAGEPWRTDGLRRAAYRLMDPVGTRRVRLYDARHACLTYLATSGVPDVVVSAWAGHADLSFTKRTYVHPNPEHLREASDALARLLG